MSLSPVEQPDIKVVPPLVAPEPSRIALTVFDPALLAEAVRGASFENRQLHAGRLSGELVRALGVACRTLELAFRDYIGLSPARYLAVLRLNAVHRELLNACEDNQRVADLTRPANMRASSSAGSPCSAGTRGSTGRTRFAAPSRHNFSPDQEPAGGPTVARASRARINCSVSWNRGRRRLGDR